MSLHFIFINIILFIYYLSISLSAVYLNCRPHYNLNLQSISVNGQPLPIDPSVFTTSNNRGTIVDSGTTLAYLAEEAYDPFISAVSPGGVVLGKINIICKAGSFG